MTRIAEGGVSGRLSVDSFISRMASRLRGESFRVDPAVPASYLVGFAVEKLVARIRGVWVLRKPRAPVFVGRNARIKCASNIHLGGFASFGSNTYVDALSRDGVTLGHGFSLGRGASIECTGSLATLGKGFTAGDNVGIGSSSFFGCAGGIEIGSDTIIGNFVSMHAENHNFDRTDIPIRLQGVNHKGIRIGKACWLGAKVTVLDGSQIGDGCVIAAGAVVREGIYPAHSLLAGVPARVIRSLKPSLEVVRHG